MALTDQDMQTLRALMREEISVGLTPLEEKFDKRFSQVAEQIDGLVNDNELRKQEYQVGR